MSNFTRQLELPGIDLDLSALDDWVKGFPEREVRQALTEIARQQQTLTRLQNDLEERLAVFERLAHPIPDPRKPTPLAEELDGAGRTVSTKRQAILQFLGRDPQSRFTAPQIRDHLIARGLIEDDPKAFKALSVMLAAMIERGEIHRPERAQYMFGPDPRASKNEGPATTSLQPS